MESADADTVQRGEGETNRAGGSDMAGQKSSGWSVPTQMKGIGASTLRPIRNDVGLLSMTSSPSAYVAWS